MYNDKGNTKYLKLLKQNYSSSQDVIREIVNLSAIINLPKGTEFFLVIYMASMRLFYIS